MTHLYSSYFIKWVTISWTYRTICPRAVATHFLYILSMPLWKKSINLVLPPSQSTLKYGSEIRPCLRGLKKYPVINYFIHRHTNRIGDYFVFIWKYDFSCFLIKEYIFFFRPRAIEEIERASPSNVKPLLQRYNQIEFEWPERGKQMVFGLPDPISN